MTLADLLHSLLFPRPAYGVWIPGIGWLKNKDGKAYADTNKRVAKRVAQRLQNGARVEYIDTALSDPSIEDKLLRVEKGGN